MATFITVSALGMLISILGIINMTGNISSLHWYHRQRVTEENRKPFGKLVGLGTLIIGLAMIVFGILFFLFEQTQITALVILGVIELIVSIVAEAFNFSREDLKRLRAQSVKNVKATNGCISLKKRVQQSEEYDYEMDEDEWQS